MRAAAALLALAAAAAAAAGSAYAQTATEGACSPIVADTAGDVSITLACRFGPDPADDFEVDLLRARLACNAAVEAEDRAALPAGEAPDPAEDLFAALQPLDGAFVYVDLSVWVGAGCGYDDLADAPFPRWGVVYDLGAALDGFDGDPEAYAYGYLLDHDFDYRDELGGAARSTLLFPADDGPFFAARYGKAMILEGMARVRVTAIQGSQFIELMPALPVGGLAAHFGRLSQAVGEARR